MIDSFAFHVRRAVSVLTYVTFFIAFILFLVTTAALVVAITARLEISWQLLLMSSNPQKVYSPGTCTILLEKPLRFVLPSGGLLTFKAVDQREVATSVSDALILLFTVLLSFLSFWQVYKERLVTNRSEILKVHDVSGKNDDLRVMERYFKHAHSATIHAGDFSFMGVHEPLYKNIQRLSSKGRLRLISFRSEGEVRKEMGGKFAEFKDFLTFDDPKRVHCSVIEEVAGKVFIYLEKEGQVGDTPRPCIYAIRERSNSHSLLRVLAVLAEH